MKQQLPMIAVFCLIAIVRAQTPNVYSWPFYDLNYQHYINSTYGELRSDDWGDRDHVHDGVDLDVLESSEYDEWVYPVLGGTVVKVVTSGYDSRVVIRHTYEYEYYYYTYNHLANIQVEENEEVGLNDIIGYINIQGSTHLHFCDGDLFNNHSQESSNPLLHLAPYEDDNAPDYDFSFGMLGIKIVENNICEEENYTSIEDVQDEFSLTVGQTYDIIVKAHDVDPHDRYGIKLGLKSVTVTIDHSLLGEIYSNDDLEFLYRPEQYYWDVEEIYAKGSVENYPNSVYYYIATNAINGDSWFDAADLDEGILTITVELADIAATGGYSENTETMIRTIDLVGSPDY